MKIAVFSPYLPDHFGGGEKYFLDVARVLAEQGHQVEVVLSERVGLTPAKLSEIREKYQAFLGQSLAEVTFTTTPLRTTASWWRKILWTGSYDCIYYLTDGSLFWSLAKRNILHIQFPFTDRKSSVIERLKLAHWSIKNTNSEFTKTVIEKHWPTKINVVHYPMVDWSGEVSAAALQPVKKEKIILNVGRFFRQLHSKRQDVLVETWRLLSTTKSSKDWKLVLVGGVEDAAYATEISKQAKGLLIEIHHQVSRSELLQWYNRASIYWHAAGFEIDPDQYPEKVEHFGISTVEAMAAGAVPIVHGKGGQLEVVGKTLREYTWQTIDECVTKTTQVIERTQLRDELATVACHQAEHFSKKRFAQILCDMIEGRL